VGVASKPDYFVIEIYNPTDKAVTLTLSIRGHERTPVRIYHKLIHASPTFTREKIPFEQISSAVDTNRTFEIELVPNEAENLTLYFGLMDFVQEKEPFIALTKRVDHARKCKCVVWDLDNSIWEGVLIEDGLEGIRLREGIVEVIVALDQRGILQSVASKNNVSDAEAALKRFGIDEYFLYPQINWSPKSQSIATIAQALNIGLDTFTFVDDQEFEREEVATALPQVRVVDVRQVATMIAGLEFQVPITEESRMRRLMYRQEEKRNALQASYQGDYLGFLRSNQMQVRLSRLTEENMQRVYELAQRTNQMNFSGNRYSIEELRRIAQDRELETYVLRCSDRFGTYGIVGFGLVNIAEPRLLDLMFSCRVQEKRVEHGFIAWLLKQYREKRDCDFFANYRKTKKNGPSGAVFEELGFEAVSFDQGVTSLRFSSHNALPDESVVELGFEVRQ
jgi:FkbH-like protein